MRQKALVVEPSRVFQQMIEKLMANAGVECHIYSKSTDALEATHDEYTFIIVSRTLEDISGEVFLKLYGVKFGLGDALTILLTSTDDSEALMEANKSGYKLVFHKKHIESLQDIVIRVANSRALDLEANILLVEDSRSVSDVMMDLFEKNRSRIHLARNLTEMRALFQTNEFDLLISDYYLGENETGDDVIAYVRNYEESGKADTPILVVSGESRQEKRVSFLRNGANDVLLKPYDSDELLVRSSNLISHSKLLKQAKKQQQELMRLALTDQLTGLYNRHSLYDVGPKYVSNALRHKTPMSLLVIDLDHFKRINDTYGHSAGDEVLRVVSSVLRRNCRTEDVAARFGGEEFIMLLTNCNETDAVNKAERLRAQIEAVQPEGLTVTSSIGVSELRDGDDIDSLFERADKSVYEAKECGRNCVVLHKGESLNEA